MNKIRTLVPMTLILMLMMVSPIAAQDVFPVTIEHKFGSTTITEQPQRVVSIGYTEQDFLLALGVQPVAVRYWYGDENDAIFPWADNYVEGDQPIVLNMPYGSLNYEAILELEPDLISAVTSGITQEEYEFLSTIAPTIAQTDDYIDFGMPWQDITLLIGQAVGKSAEAEALVADVEGQFAAVRAANPQFADHTVAVSFWSEDTYGYYTDEDSRGRFFVDLGFSMPEELMEVAGDSFYAYISEERMDLIDQDLIAIVNLQFIPGGQEELEAQPLFSQLAAVQAGHVIYFDETAENALGFSSPLSLSYALAAALPQLEAMFPSSDQSESMACEEGFRAFAGTCIPENPERVFTVTDSDLDALLALGIGPIGITNGRGQ
ncbi:MAG: ABC transporter substrate-binding protein, partial [Anaerolineae bacterium]|nr:ABC transporter substrate-binding protein [Anaerolineae bacterium]